LIAATDGFAEARKVGEGGFGRVYRADALPSLPRVACGFAVKTALVGVGAQGLAELQSEVRTLSAACHPSLLPLLGVCLAPSRACLVYPLCRGGSLEDRLYRSPAALQRLRMLGFETAPPPLSSAARLRVLRDAARALHYLHTLSPMILHRDVSAGNILLDERGNGYLADVGLARAAEATAGAQVSHLSTQRIFGKPGYMDPIILNDGQASQLTDGFALGITLLVALTGRGALGLLSACDDALEEPDTAESIAAADAGWSAAQAEELARLVVGLAFVRKKKRMPLAEALPRLEALVEAAGAVEETAGAEERQCDLCYDAPRSVRFACGHALYCEACAPRVLERDTNCPACRRPALPIVDTGAGVAAQTTFVYQSPRARHNCVYW
ncbi:hypothetical protein EMIHUDRAFT_241925, partial [Emiliania huxleyi CCMP1516]|uniref:Protein kinase domain-containing protein n=2 Tax=Emiliania huxleyi TaxID=2903 RepID=A0A0D3JB25_EMIH1